MAELLITIGYIVLFAIIAGLLASKFKLPSVIGLLLIGSIVGPNALGIIKDIDLIHGAADLGAILLLFLIGLEFSISKLLSSGLRVFIVALFKIAICFFFGYEISLLLGFSEIISLYIGIMLSISSTAIFIKVVEERKLSKNQEIPLLIGILVLEDIFAVFALTFFSALGDAGQLTATVLLKKLGSSIVIITLSYLILLKVFKKGLQWVIKNTTEDTFAFIAIGICIGFSLLAAMVKLSPSIGAFLAGSLIASFPEARRFQETLHPLSLTFIALFFLSLGMLINFGTIFKYF
ncbi:MAG: cation:proton antiporter, partial [Nanoarchaeota archaeon]